MSVKLETKETSSHGRLFVESDSSYLDAETYLARMRAIVELVQAQNPQMVSEETTYHALEILADMLPTAEQARKMFNTPH